jgi:transposase InsO family protein
MERFDIVSQIEDAQTAGLSRTAALREARISAGTWRNWQRWQEAGQPLLALRGRPPHCATHAERQSAIRLLVEQGSHLPLHALREHLPNVTRAELDDLRRRYGRAVRRRLERFRGRLDWKHTGAVWSMDFTEPKEYIGGTDRWILAIRDLASGYQLTWLSFTHATAECVIAELNGLFQRHGPPLVLKSDNGSQFIAEATRALLEQWIVAQLFNPPRRPAYNGGLERTHPILKSYTDAAAAVQGRPAAWQPEDLEIGVSNANRFTRRHGPTGPTADELWQSREPIDDGLRRAFQETLASERLRARAARGYAPENLLNHYQAAAVDRDAIRETLVKHGLLEIEPLRGRHAMPATEMREVETSGSLETRRDAEASTSSLAPLAPSAPSTAARPVSGEGTQKSLIAVAPPAPASGRIAPALIASPCPEHALPNAGPAHCEPAKSNIVRRLITPLITRLRSAIIR